MSSSHLIRIDLARASGVPAHRKEETMTEALKKDYQKTCAERIDEQWKLRREDLWTQHTVRRIRVEQKFLLLLTIE